MSARAFKQVSKYRAKRTGVYASKREAEYAASLDLAKRAGHVAYWLEQVPVKLPGGLKYVCDFLVFYADGRVAFVEVKGVQTPVWKAKLRLLEESQPEVFARLEVVR